MNATGKQRTLALLCGLWLCAAPALAAVDATLDRSRAVLGDSLRLTLTATEDEELSEVDLRPLLDDFEILRRSSSSQLLDSLSAGLCIH